MKCRKACKRYYLTEVRCAKLRCILKQLRFCVIYMFIPPTPCPVNAAFFVNTYELVVSIGQLFSGNCALNETVGTRLRGINLGILSSVFETLVPAQINLEIMLVRQ